MKKMIGLLVVVFTAMSVLSACSLLSGENKEKLDSLISGLNELSENAENMLNSLNSEVANLAEEQGLEDILTDVAPAGDDDIPDMSRRSARLHPRMPMIPAI